MNLGEPSDRWNDALIRAVPELSLAYERERSAWGDSIPPHITYHDLLIPHVRRLLAAAPDPEVEERLRAIFSFLEELAGSSDNEATDLIRATVAPALEEDGEVLERARRYMGPLLSYETRNRIPYRRPRRLGPPRYPPAEGGK